jgi:hypothetical protein
MVNRRRGVLIVGLAVVAAVASIALADVIFVYTGQLNVSPTTAPLSFTTGPNAGPSSTGAEPYINFTGTNSGFTVSLVITNSYAVYYYEAGELTVNTAGYIYVNSISISGSAVNTLTIYIAPSSSPNTYTCTIQVISGGSAVQTPTTPCSLNSGTYYIHIYVSPNLPVTSTSTETVTVTFGYNVVGNTAVPVP